MPGSLPERIARKLESEERLITAYGGTRVRMDLDRIPLWSERRDITIDALWKAYCQYPYLPRLASFDVLRGAISDGTSKLDWRETFAYAEGHDETRWVGLTVASHVSARPGGFLVAPEAAEAQIDADRADASPDGGDDGEQGAGDSGSAHRTSTTVSGTGAGGVSAAATFHQRFYGQFPLDSVRAIRQLEDILTNVVEHLNGAPNGQVELTLEINATSEGFDDRVERVVKENADQLGAKSREFE